MKNYSFMWVLLMGILLVGCQSSDSEKVIASEEGYTLTQDHFKNYIAHLEMESGTLSFSEKDNERAKLLDFFYADPEGTLEELRSIARGEISKSTLADDDIPTLQEDSNLVQELGDAALSAPIQASKSIANNLAQGHQEVRRLLGGDIGEMQFDTQAANTFRSYIANSLLTTTSSNANRGYNSSDYSSSQGQIQFCANGTFVEVLSGYLSIDVEGASAMSSGSDAMPGYWEAAALPNGMFIILMYSTHPRMLEDFPKGFMPFIVAKHDVDFVALPGGDLYRRNANQYCN